MSYIITFAVGILVGMYLKDRHYINRIVEEKYHDLVEKFRSK